MAEPSIGAVKYLFAHSRNLGFFNLPEDRACEVTLTEKGYGRTRGEVAHICAEAPGGPRYDPSLSDAECQAEPNLMLLCPNCHKRVDYLEPERFLAQGPDPYEGAPSLAFGPGVAPTSAGY
jgi:hypothetical protein